MTNTARFAVAALAISLACGNSWAAPEPSPAPRLTLEMTQLGAASGAPAKRRQQLAREAWERFLRDADYTARADPDELTALIRAAGGWLSGAERADLLRRVQVRFAPDRATLASMPARRLLSLRSAALSLGGDEARTGWVNAWVHDGRAWEAASTEELTRVLGCFPRVAPSAGPTRASLDTLADTSLTRFLSEPAVREGRVRADMFRLAAAFGDRLTPPQRARFVERLRGLLEDPKAFARLGPQDLDELRLALIALRSPVPEWSDRLAAWVTTRDDWRLAGPSELARLLLMVHAAAAQAPAAKPALAAVGDAVVAYLAEPAHWKERGGSDLTGLFELIGRVGTPEQRARALVAATSEVVNKTSDLPAGALTGWRSALLGLDPKGEAFVRLYGNWLTSHPGWPRLPAPDLVVVLGALDGRRYPALAGVRDQVAAQLQRPESVGRLPARDFARIALPLAKMEGIGDPAADKGGPVVAITGAWMSARPEWRDEPLSDLLTISNALSSKLRPALAEVQSKLADGIIPVLVGAYDQGTNAGDFAATAAGFAASLPAAERAKLAAAIAERTHQAPTGLRSLSAGALATLLTSLKGAEQAPPALSALVRDWASAGLGAIEPPDTAYSTVWSAASSGDPKLASALEAQLFGTSATMSLRSAMLIAYAQLSLDDARAWRKRLDAETASAKEPDARAMWLLARAYAEETGPGSSPGEGQPWLDRALGTAESEPVRLWAFQWIVQREIAAQQPERAAGMLASAKGQFETEASKQKLESISAAITAARDGETKRQSDFDRMDEIERTVGQVQYLQEQLERARSDKRPAEDLASLEKAINASKDKLVELSNEAG